MVIETQNKKIEEKGEMFYRKEALSRNIKRVKHLIQASKACDDKTNKGSKNLQLSKMMKKEGSEVEIGGKHPTLETVWWC